MTPHLRTPALALLLALVLPPALAAAGEAPAGGADAAALARQDIAATLGSVPSFFAAFPPAALPGAWQAFRDLQLNPNTALPGATKELVGLAVAAQVPCSYCVYAHTEAARLGGASDAQIAEALATAALVRQWSTVLNGNEVDETGFRRDFDAIYAGAGERPAAPPVQVVDAASAYRDVEQALGSMPAFFRAWPEASFAGAWNEFKHLSADGALPAKDKELIGLAVASQIPCSYCIYAHRRGAMAQGASAQEIQEAVAMAGLTRHWSTFLNGLALDPATFRREVDAMFRFAMEQAAATGGHGR
jgi:AhpD family alkylhydroperoxidase